MRPFEPTNMTTALWKLITPRELEISILVPVQPDPPEDLKLPEGHSFCGDPFIHVVYYNSIYYISDGHNRVAEAKRKGQTSIIARLLIK